MLPGKRCKYGFECSNMHCKMEHPKTESFTDVLRKVKISVPRPPSTLMAVYENIAGNKLILGDYEMPTHLHQFDGVVLRSLSKVTALSLAYPISRVLGANTFNVLDICGSNKSASYASRIARCYSGSFSWTIHSELVVGEDYLRAGIRGETPDRAPGVLPADSSIRTSHMPAATLVDDLKDREYDVLLIEDVHQQGLSDVDSIIKLASKAHVVVLTLHHCPGDFGPTGYHGFYYREQSLLYDRVINYPHAAASVQPYVDTCGYDVLFERTNKAGVSWRTEHIYANVFVVAFFKTLAPVVGAESPWVYQPRVIFKEYMIHTHSWERKNTALLDDDDTYAIMGLGPGDYEHSLVRPLLETASPKKRLCYDTIIVDKFVSEYSGQTLKAGNARTFRRSVTEALDNENYVKAAKARRHIKVVDNLLTQLYAGTCVEIQRRITSVDVLFSLAARADADRTSMVETSYRLLTSVYMNMSCFHYMYARGCSIICRPTCCSLSFSWPHFGYSKAKEDSDKLRYVEACAGNGVWRGDHLMIHRWGMLKVPQCDFPQKPTWILSDNTRKYRDGIKPSSITTSIPGLWSEDGLKFTSAGLPADDPMTLKTSVSHRLGPAAVELYHLRNSAVNMTGLLNDVIGPSYVSKEHQAAGFEKYINKLPILLARLGSFEGAMLTPEQIIAWMEGHKNKNLYLAAYERVSLLSKMPNKTVALMLKRSDPVLKRKLRNIANVSPDRTVLTAPYVVFATMAMIEFWQLFPKPVYLVDLPPYFGLIDCKLAYTPLYGGCTTPELLSELLVRMKDILPNNIISIASGDDSGFAACIPVLIGGYKQTITTYIEGDLSTFDRTKTAAALDIQNRYLIEVGVPRKTVEELIKIQKANIRITNPELPTETITIDMSESPCQRSGAGDTSFGNTVVKISLDFGFTSAFALALQNLEADEIVFETVSEYEAWLLKMYVDFHHSCGFKIKAFLRNSIHHLSFLKGQLLKYDNGFVWVPSFAKIVKTFAHRTDPTTYRSFNHISNHHMRLSNFCYSVIKPFKAFDGMPFYSEMIDSLERYVSKDIMEIKEDKPWKPTFTENVVYKGIDYLPMFEFYDICPENQEVLELRKALKFWEPGTFIESPIFEILADKEYR